MMHTYLSNGSCTPSWLLLQNKARQACQYIILYKTEALYFYYFAITTGWMYIILPITRLLATKVGNTLF